MGENLTDDRKLNHLRALSELSGCPAFTIQALARNRDSMMQIIELIAFKVDGLLAAPAEIFRPSGETKRNSFDSRLLFYDDFDLPVFTI